MRRAVILNDTRGHHHFGCHRVMEVIEQKLSARGFEISARSLVRQRWWKNSSFLNALKACDLIVINGEGTLHHGSRHGPRLLTVAEHPARGAAPVALVNALYQENPQQWKPYIDRIDYLNTRDSLSANELGQLAGRDVRCTLDFSLCGGDTVASPTEPAQRETLLLGDSVVREANASLIQVARATPDTVYLPIVRTIKSSKPQYGHFRYAIREAYVHARTFLFKQSLKNARFCRDYREYCDQLRTGRLHVTGRFHGVCLSLATGTPFLGLSSNSWKVEALLDDIGLGQDRLITPDRIAAEVREPTRWAFTEAEQGKVQAALARANFEVDAVFDEIASLV